MDKLLVSGVNDGFAQMVLEEMKNRFEVIECEFSESNIRRTIRMQKPRLFLSFKSDSQYATMYADLRDSYPGVGISIICDTPVVTLQKLFIPGLYVLARPVNLDDILESLEEVKLESEVKEPPKSILAVDDNAMILRNIKEILGNEYEVSLATSGKKAFENLEKKNFDLILLDYEMPTMSGLEVFKKIKKSADYKDIPVVFLTGVAQREKIVEVVELKPAGYLLKPIETVALRNLLAEVIG